jgi:hypothetical protein
MMKEPSHQKPHASPPTTGGEAALAAGQSRPFLICALPRSRTAWLANFLTHGAVHCAHELSEGAADAAAIVARMQRRREGIRFRGNSDSAQMLVLPELLELLPRAALVVIRRREEAVADSLTRLGFPAARAVVRELGRYLEAAAQTPGAFVLEYEDLQSESALRALQAHVAPGEPFDRERWLMLRHLNVQLTAERFVTQLRDADIHALQISFNN